MSRVTQPFVDLYERIPEKYRAAAFVGAIAVLYVIGLQLPGIGHWLHQKMPYEVVVIGLISGSVTALLAIGLILIYRANRFINFAYGSMGSFVGVMGVALYKVHHWSYFVVLPLVVVGGLINGALIELIVIRRFANATRLVLTVASIGLAQFLGGLEFLTAKKLGFISLTGGFDIPIHLTMHIGVKTLKGDEILIMMIVPFVILGLAFFLLKTDSGVAVRAAAENADRALLLGIPVRRLATIVWALAGALSALTFILKAPFSGVVPGIANGPTVLLPGLAAAVVARMESLPVAFGAGLGLGIAEETVRWNSTGSPSFVNVAYLVVILAALLLQSGKLSRALDNVSSSWSATGIVKPIPVELRRLPEVRYVKIALLSVVGILAIWLPSGWSSSHQLLAAFAMVWAMVAVSLVVLTGWGGHISLGQFGFVGVGAITAGNVVSKWHGDFLFALLLAGAAGAACALLVGLPALRIKGLFLAVTTLAFAIALDEYFFNTDRFSWLLPSSVSRVMLFQRFNLEFNYDMYLTTLAFLVVSILAALGVRKARSGRVVIATRDNERAADAAAVNTTAVKLSAFILAGFIAGMAGALHVQIQHALAQHTYQPADSITVFSTAVIGGLGSITGAISGVLLFRYLETITALGDLRLLLTGTGLLVVLYALPGGFGQLFVSVRDRYLRWVANRRDIIVPSLVADKRGQENSVGMLQGALTDEVSDEAGLEVIGGEELVELVESHHG
ncbi:MAG TPA: ABC transporter permease [Acidimicrobiales bacterium]|nr:ABC transporter permease [Acidimicrobiales bacterium]